MNHRTQTSQMHAKLHMHEKISYYNYFLYLLFGFNIQKNYLKSNTELRYQCQSFSSVFFSRLVYRQSEIEHQK